MTRDFILGVCMAYYNSDSLNSIVLECYETLCTHVSAGNCVFVDTADPASEHVPKPSLKTLLEQYKCEAETMKYHKTKLPKFTDAL